MTAAAVLLGVLVAPTAAFSAGTGPGIRPSCAAPGAPGSVSATPGINQAAVSWTAAANNGTTITAYIMRSASGPNVGQSLATNGTATSATMGGLGGGTAATFSVAAQSACGTGTTATSTAVTPSGASSTYDTTVLGDHPSAYYRLSDPSGPVMTDSSGASADGLYSNLESLNQPGAIPNDPDGSVNTAGSTIGQAAPVLPTGNSARTVEVWFKTQGPGCCQPYEALLSYGQSATDQLFALSIGASSILVSGYNDYQVVTTPRPIEDGAWHLVTITYDGVHGEVYVDGRPLAATTFAGALNTASTPGLVLGTEPGGQPNTSTFNGDMQDVAMYPTALSAAKVLAHFASSGYSFPTAPSHVHASFAGNNAAQVTWGIATATNTSIVDYLISVASGPNKGESQTVDGDATAVQLTGLAAGAATFQVQAFDSFGPGPKAKSKLYTVPGAAGTYDSLVLANKPAAFYRLSDSTTGGPTCSANAFVPAMADSSGHGATGIYQCAFPGQSGPLGNDPATGAGDAAAGQNSVGTGMGPVTATTTAPQGNSARTVEVWTQTTQPSAFFAGMPLVTWGENAAGTGFGVFEPSATDIVVSDSGDDHSFFTPYRLDDGAWHQIVATYDGAHITVYLDGKPIGTQAFTLNVINTLPGTVLVGATPFGIFGGDGWDLGSMNLADAAVYPTALKPSQVGAHFAAAGYSVPAPPTNPIATAGANSASITWTAAPAADPPITGYVVTAVQGRKSRNAISVAGSATSATITGLQGTKPYTFKVHAVNEYGSGASVTSNSVTPTGSTTTYASTVLADNPSAFFRLGDSADVAMTDSSGSGVTGRYNAPYATLGITPGALVSDPNATAVGNPNFSGNAGNFATALTSVPTGNSSRTVEGWMHLAPCQGSDCFNPLVTWGSGGTDTGFTVTEFGSTSLYVAASNDTQGFTAPYPLTDGAWHQIIVTYDGTTNIITLYLDGTKVGTASFAGTLNTQNSPLGIGENAFIGNAQSADAFNVDDVSVYPSVLSATQVAAHYAAAGSTPPALDRPFGVHVAH